MADLSITAANVVAGANASRNEGIAGATVTAGAVLYREASSNTWKLADNNAGTAEIRGAVAVALGGASNGQPIFFQTSGPITIGATLTPGTAYYLSGTPGKICPLGDLATGMDVVLIGVAQSTSVLLLGIQNSGVTL